MVLVTQAVIGGGVQSPPEDESSTGGAGDLPGPAHAERKEHSPIASSPHNVQAGKRTRFQDISFLVFALT